MNLHSASFERRTRRLVQERVRASPALKRERKRQSSVWRRHFSIPPSFLRLAGTGGLVYLLYGGAPQQNPLEYRLALLALWGLAASYYRARALTQALHQDLIREPFVYLPATDLLVFRWQAQNWLLKGIAVAVDYLAGFCVLGLTLEIGPLSVLSLAFVTAALVQWLLILALSILLLNHHHLLRIARVVAGLIVIGLLALFFDRHYTGPAFAIWLGASWQWLGVVLPTGWVPDLFNAIAVGNPWPSLLLAGPLLLLFAAGARSWKRLQHDYRLDFESLIPATEMSDEDKEAWERAQGAAAPIGPTATLESIEAGAFREGLALKGRMPLGQWVEGWLTPREKTLITALFSEYADWRGFWTKGWLILMVGGLVGWWVQRMGASWFLWLDGAALYLVATQNLGTTLPINAQFLGMCPVAFREMLRLHSKFALVRGLIAWPMFIAYGAFLAWRFQHAPLSGAILGLKASLAILAAAPFFLTVAVSSGTDDTRNLRLKSLGPILIGLVFLGLMIGSAVGAVYYHFAGPYSWTGWLWLIGIAITAWLFALFYRRLYDRRRFDLF